MQRIMVLVVFLSLVMVSNAFCEIKWITSEHSSRGGYFRDTSNDGVKENNANYLGYNN